MTSMSFCSISIATISFWKQLLCCTVIVFYCLVYSVGNEGSNEVHSYWIQYDIVITAEFKHEKNLVPEICSISWFIYLINESKLPHKTLYRKLQNYIFFFNYKFQKYNSLIWWIPLNFFTFLLVLYVRWTKRVVYL